MVGNAGSDERILIQEIFEPKLLSTFETHAPVYAAEKQVGVVLDILCIGAYPCSSILLFLISHSSGAHMVNFATLSTCLDLEVARLPQFRRQLLQPSCTWKAVLSAYQHILAVNAEGEIGKFDPTSTALRAVTLRRKDEKRYNIRHNNQAKKQKQLEKEQVKRHFHALSSACDSRKVRQPALVLPSSGKKH